MADEFAAARPAILRGAGIALALHASNDDECCRYVTAQLTPELRESVAAAQAQTTGLIRLSCRC
jgi:hypothetical protein